MRFDPNLTFMIIAGIVLLAALVSLFAPGGRRLRGLRRVLMGLLLVGVALMPKVGGVPLEGVSIPVDVVILADRTGSMGAEDWDGGKSRLEGISADAQELMTVLTGARMTVVTFDSQVKQEVPFTTDPDSIVSLLSSMGFQDMGRGEGSSISIALPLATELLAASQAEQPDRTRYLIYLGDGEQTSDKPIESFAPLRGLIDGALVLGYGTEQGGKMRAGWGNNDYYPDSNEPDGLARSRIDEDNLRQIADDLGGEYLHRTGPGPIDFQIEMGGGKSTRQTYIGAMEAYWVPGLGVAFLLLLEVWDLVPALRRAREELV